MAVGTPYITTAELKTALAQAYQTPDEEELGIGAVTLANAVRFGYNEIIDRMTRRGFSQGQIDAWDRRVEFNTQLSLFWCFAYGGVPTSGDDKWVKNFDVRKDLNEVGLFIDGLKVWPTLAKNEDPGGKIGGGMLTAYTNIPPPRW